MAADYKQPKTMEKRVRFFDGQFLQDQDFIDEQKYHLDRERRHNRLLHVAGIAEGLTVTSPESNKIIVAAGTAIDSEGRQIALAQPQTVELPAATFNDQHGIKLYIAFREIAVDLQQSETGSDDYTRWHELPEITIVGPGEDSVSETPRVLLAELALDNQGAVTINHDVRQYSGLRLPGSGVNTAILRSNLVNYSIDLTGSLTIHGWLKVKDILEIDDASITGKIQLTRKVWNELLKEHFTIYTAPVAIFSHKDHGTRQNYALAQGADGDTNLNAAKNQFISFRIGDEEEMSLRSTNDGLTVKRKLSVNDIAIIKSITVSRERPTSLGPGTISVDRQLATFSHKKNETEKNYALGQSYAGDTYLNAAEDQSISFRINDEPIKTLNKDGWIDPSDARLKQDIKPFCEILHRVMQLHPRSYFWATSKNRSKRSIGFIAHEVEKIFPDFIREDQEFKGLCYDNFSVLAIAAIQEQQQSIEKLQKEISNLKEKITNLTK